MVQYRIREQLRDIRGACRDQELPRRRRHAAFYHLLVSYAALTRTALDTPRFVNLVPMYLRTPFSAKRKKNRPLAGFESM